MISSDDLFTRVYRNEMVRVAQSAHALPLHTRLWMLALADANNDGHAEYSGAREILSKIGPNVVTKTGEVKPWSPNAFGNALKTAIALDLLDPSSGPRCLVLRSKLAAFSGPGGQGCRYHGIKGRRRASDRTRNSHAECE